MIIKKIMNINMSLGWPSLMAAVCFFSGIILIGIGLTGEYIGRAFMCINATPQYVVKEEINVQESVSSGEEKEE